MSMNDVEFVFYSDELNGLTVASKHTAFFFKDALGEFILCYPFDTLKTYAFRMIGEL